MILRILNTFHLILNYSVWMFLIYLLRRDKSRISYPRLSAGCASLGIALAVLYQFWESYFDASLGALNHFIFVAYILSAFHVFWVFPGKWHKNMFFVSLTISITAIGHGLGNLSESYIPFSETGARLVNLLLSGILLALLLISFILFIHRPFPALYESEHSILWKRLWMIVLSLGMMQVTVGGIYKPETFRGEIIIPARLVCLCALAIILYIAGSTHEQAQKTARLEAETAAINELTAEKEKEYREIVKEMEYARRLRHDMRQIYTAIHGLNKPETQPQLIEFCEETLLLLKTQEGGESV